MNHSPLSGEIEIYQNSDEGIVVETRFNNDSIWLTQADIASLYNVDRTVISKHLKNIFQSGELDEKRNVQKMHIPNSDKPVKIYDLDVIISTGYRVNTKRATQFRIWATNVIKNHLIQGYSINPKRLNNINWTEFDKTLNLIKSTSSKRILKSPESIALLDIISRYTKTFVLLQSIDTNTLQIPSQLTQAIVQLDINKFRSIISEFKIKLIEDNQASDIFGQERGDGFDGIIGSIHQTFGGQDLYNTLDEKAAHLLYFIIKDHPFSDGNKRIGSLLFIYYLSKNNYLKKKSGEVKINDNALTALALLIAESDPKDKELMINLIMHLLS